MAKKITLFVLLFYVGFFEARAYFLLDNKSDEVNLQGHLSFFADKSQKLTKESVKKILFLASDKTNFSLGYSNLNFWIKTDFKYVADQTESFVFSLQVPTISRVQFYLFNQNGKEEKSLITGTEKPFETREDQIRHYIFSFQPKPNSSYTLYILAHNDFGSINIPIKLTKKASFMRFYDKESFFLYLFQGILIVSFIISFALFVNFKDKTYLFYAIYIFAVFCSRITIFGFMFQYFHPENPELVPVTKVVFIILMAIGFINFVPFMLSSQKQHFRKIQTFFYIQSALYFTLILYSFTPFPQTLLPEFNRFWINFMNFNFAVSITLILYMVYKSLKSKYSPPRYFALAIAPLLLIIIYIMLNNYKVINLIGPIYNYPFEIGFSIEIVLLFGGLINRHKIMMQEQKLDFEKKISQLQTHYRKSSEPAEKYLNSKYTLIEISEKHKLLQSFMLLDRPYLNQELNLASLAEQLDIQQNLLSQIII